MRPDNAVPDEQLLRRFLLGQLSREEAAPIEHYLEAHPEESATLAGLLTDDSLTASLRNTPIPAATDPPEVADLMDKLARLHAAAANANEVTAVAPSDSPSPASADDDTFAGLAPPQAAGEVGRLGGYRILKMLGSGGMGMVYHAEDLQLQRPVALKVMKPKVADDPTARERFLREARAAAQLRSDHIVSIYQVGEAGPVAFLAMEFLEGMSLEEWLRKERQPTFAQAARIGRQIALGLAAAHERGLIHRDIKPGNVWLESANQGRAKLLDFGLAHTNVNDPHLTQSGTIVGTLAYMAPEQARGEKVDARAALFSLGVVLYRLCTGQLPFQGDNMMAVLMSLAVDQPQPPREINPALPPRLAALIERLLAKDREQRPATAKAVAAELAAIEREVVGQVPGSPTGEPTHAKRRRPWLVAAGLLMLLAGLTAGIVVIIRDKQGREVARVNVPEGGKAEIVDDAKGKDEAKGRPEPTKGVRIKPAPVAPLLAGEPLSPLALVRQPARLPGVRSWTIAQRDMRWPKVAAYRPDGKRLAVGGDGVVHVWEPQTARLMQVLFGHGSIISLAWSPDGRVLAVGSWTDKQVIQLWEAETGRLLRGLEAPEGGQVPTLAWSPDGRAVLAGLLWWRLLRLSWPPLLEGRRWQTCPQV